MSSVREAADLAQTQLGIDRLLISPDLRTSAGDLLLDRYTDLLEREARPEQATGVTRDPLNPISFIPGVSSWLGSSLSQ